ncbi:4-hydroxy-2-oxoglutarate aldolase, mitochondrial [Octopus sinensis]|uniref:4-hydroxy-2-oxoglutarate aldolase, mitochondrial n=1 Tax=Octopus sinensis TaxID=2607531 RepID=A0A6P7U626_9MOLL|nr:4-hydroxy-2-oxoglutarate aldolase, mitochondrial [Octopus sinensis]
MPVGNLFRRAIRTGYLCATSCRQNRILLASLSTQTKNKLDLAGIFPPITTPFNADETIAFDKLEKNLSLWKNIPFKGYTLMGSNGEYVFLSLEERLDIVQKVISLTKGDDKIIMVGTGCESTQATIKFTNQIASVGADTALVVTPCYYKGGMSNSALIQHYRKVADNSLIPILLYSVPSNTSIDLAEDVIIQLADHPNIIGLKDSGGNIAKLSNIIFATKNKDFQVLAGSASFLYPALMAGCVGGVCALANVLGKDVCNLQSLFEKGLHSSAIDLQLRLVAPNQAVTAKYGIPGLKVAMEWFGFYGGHPRSPLQPLTEEQALKMKEDFTTRNFMQ